MRSIGTPEITVIILVAAAYLYPCWRIAQKMGYPGSLGMLIVIPGINIIAAWFVAFDNWPALDQPQRPQPGR